MAEFFLQCQCLFGQLQVAENKIERLLETSHDESPVDEVKGGELQEMPRHVGRSEHAHIGGEGQFRGDRAEYADDNKREHPGVERCPRADEKKQRHEEECGYDVFADDLERGEPCALDEAVGEGAQVDQCRAHRNRGE